MPDAFDQLGLPPRFDLTAAQVRAAYLARATAVHPDHAGGGASGAALPGALDGDSARLNHARATLADPEQRAEALLARLGGPAKETDRSLPDGFLMEMMDVREQLDASVSARDSAGVSRWLAWADERRARHVACVGELFFGAMGGGTTQADRSVLVALRRELNAWRYIERMIEQIDAPAGGGEPRGG